MRRGLALLVAAALLLGVSNLWAQQSGSKDSASASAASWHVSKVLTLSRARAGDAAQPSGGPLKYLHIQINFSPTAAEKKLHNFRVTDERGNAVGDLWGYNDNESLLIFEGEQPWTSLTGLYLDGQGHREPLFTAVKPAVVAAPPVAVARPAAVAPRPVVVPVETPRSRVVQAPTFVPTPTVVPSPTIVQTPTRVVETPFDTVVPNVVVRTPTVVRPSTTVIEDPARRVVVDDSDVVVRVPTTVVGGRNRVVVDDRDRVVVDDRDVVVHDGGTRVVHRHHVHRGTQVVDGGTTVVEGGGTTVIKGGSKVVDDGTDVVDAPAKVVTPGVQPGGRYGGCG